MYELAIYLLLVFVFTLFQLTHIMKVNQVLYFLLFCDPAKGLSEKIGLPNQRTKTSAHGNSTKVA